MIQDVQQLLDDYVAWLRDKTLLRQVQDWVEITTPYLDRHNDYIQIYARKANGAFTLTDDGYTIEDVRSGAVDVEDAADVSIFHVDDCVIVGSKITFNRGRLKVPPRVS